jgi:putative nucleotidyltransferase with HDIG domain
LTLATQARIVLPSTGPRPTSPDQGSPAWVAAALEAALKARAPGVYASTPLVAQLASRLARELSLDDRDLALLDIAARVRDVGMIALADTVVLATRRRSSAEWELVNRHPVLGEEMLRELSVVSAAGPLVRAHHERWDGGGYPDGLTELAIPQLSRIIATCDAFVAIASDRPHRRGLGAAAALEGVLQESGAQFDPATVDALTASLAKSIAPKGAPVHTPEVAAGDSQKSAPANSTHRLKDAIAEFDVVPVLAPAYERILEATASEHTLGGELVAAVESDTGLTVAVLRAAQPLEHRRPIVNVADAVAALGVAGVDAAVRPLPRSEFPWRTSHLQVLMHRSLVHAQAVARAADRIAREVDLADRDDVLAAALLHDVGKLALGRGPADYPTEAERTFNPEERVRRERTEWGVDHASLGGVLLSRWGLPKRLAGAVAAHHSAEAENDIATYVRLADMVAHHAQGEAVDSARMLALSALCGVSASVLRAILFDLPYSGGSRRRRAEPSPLSNRETTIVRLLAEGKRYKEIALELDLAASTVRTHLHNVYAKIGVDDRAQAVLRVTEMGWI